MPLPPPFASATGVVKPSALFAAVSAKLNAGKNFPSPKSVGKGDWLQQGPSFVAYAADRSLAARAIPPPLLGGSRVPHVSAVRCRNGFWLGIFWAEARPPV